MRLDDHEDCLADRHEGISLAANGQKEGAHFSVFGTFWQEIMTTVGLMRRRIWLRIATD